MKNTFQSGLKPGFLALGAAVAVLFSGCATPKQHYYNADFGADLRTKPTYYIQDEDSTHFTVTVQSGTPSNGPERVTDVKVAAQTIATAECQRRQWKQWKLDYTQERNLGWQHFVVAEVTQEKYIAPTFPQSTNGNP